MNGLKQKKSPEPVKEALSFCQATHHYYSSTAFPRICNTCEKSYLDRAQFLKETVLLPKGTYSKGTKDKVFEYRNCQCGSTLVCVVESNRDESPEGIEMRKDFSRKMQFLIDNGIDKKRAKEIVLAKVRHLQSEVDCSDDEALAG